MDGGMRLDAEAVHVAALLTAAQLRLCRRQGVAPPSALVSLAGQLGPALAPAERQELWVLIEASAWAGRSDGTRGSAVGALPPAQPGSELTAVQAARLACCSSRAVRAACTDGRLSARKHPADYWLIDPVSFEKWRRSRAA